MEGQQLVLHHNSIYPPTTIDKWLSLTTKVHKKQPQWYKKTKIRSHSRQKRTKITERRKEKRTGKKYKIWWKNSMGKEKKKRKKKKKYKKIMEKRWREEIEKIGAEKWKERKWNK